MKINSSTQNQIERHLEKNQHSMAMRCFDVLNLPPEERGKLIALKARLEGIQSRGMLGTTTEDDRRTALAKLRNDILLFLDQVKNEPATISPFVSESIPQDSESSQSATFSIGPRNIKTKHIAMTLLIVLIPVIFLASQFFDLIQPQPNSFTVLVHGAKGTEDRFLQEEGTLEIVHPNFPLREKIDADGMAVFKEVPSSLFDKGVGLKMRLSQTSRSIYILNPDSVYQISKGATLQLQLVIEGLDRIRGVVKSIETNMTIPDVKIQVGELSTVTDSSGKFNLPIPERLQSRAQTIVLSKQGYRTTQFNEKHLEGDKPLTFQLNKE